MSQDKEFDVRKAFEAIAYILSQRTNIKVTVKDFKQKEKTIMPLVGKEETK